MVSFLEHKEHFIKLIRWCDNKMHYLKNNASRSYTEEIDRIQEYKRDCSIICRQIDLLNKKYPNFSEIPSEMFEETKSSCLQMRFNKLQVLENYLKSQNITTDDQT